MAENLVTSVCYIDITDYGGLGKHLVQCAVHKELPMSHVWRGRLVAPMRHPHCSLVELGTGATMVAVTVLVSSLILEDEGMMTAHCKMRRL